MARSVSRGWKIKVLMFSMLLMLLVSAPACRPRVFNDGTFTGISQADSHGYAIAEVRIEKDKIASVKLTEMTEVGVEKDYETYPWPQAKEAKDTLEKAFVGRQDTNVDVVAQATNSSNKFKEAVGFALEKARKKPTINSTYFEGTFMGKSKEDDHGWGVAWVTIQGDKITDVEVEDVTPDGEFKDWATYSYTPAIEAKAEMPKRFVEANSAVVDVYTGATNSSTKWMEAVSAALAAAKIR
ncbi:MAG TPA: FMN-binding protein [Firmicutes bacterium]|nr:FMN-binding protein [Candidatus Fermentithermobacillaceae bacterium]